MGKFKIIVIVLVCLWLASYLIAQFVSTEIGDKIAVIPIKGAITGSVSSPLFYQGSTTSTDIIALLEEAEKNSNVKAILLEINSPGGTVVASKEVVEAVKKVEKPIVAWIRDIGASGAYWVASASDKIVADELSLTGSIGVVSSYLEFSDLFEEHGITYEGLKSGEYKDIGSPFKKLTDEERKLLLGKINLIHEYFVKDVSVNRGLAEEDVAVFANGIYYLGLEAKEMRLVDYLGGEEKALNVTKELANLTEADTLKFEKEANWFDVLGKLSTNAFYFMGKGVGEEVGRVDLKTTPSFYA